MDQKSVLRRRIARLTKAENERRAAQANVALSPADARYLLATLQGRERADEGDDEDAVAAAHEARLDAICTALRLQMLRLDQLPHCA